MSYQFANLPYAYDALAPVINEETLHFHKDKHHKAYFDKFTAAIADTDYNGKSFEEIFANISKLPTAVRNNGGGFFNHDMYFNGLRAPQKDNTPTGQLLEAINRDFGSFAKLKEELSTASANQFGSGWGWLIVQNGKLVVTNTLNQDNPLMDIANVKGTPILACDVWEHAYYLDYQNRRPDYISSWWDIVNWDFVEKGFLAAI